MINKVLKIHNFVSFAAEAQAAAETNMKAGNIVFPLENLTQSLAWLL